MNRMKQNPPSGILCVDEISCPKIYGCCLVALHVSASIVMDDQVAGIMHHLQRMMDNGAKVWIVFLPKVYYGKT